jgi:acetyl-CoA C-acetyltransferase
MPDAFDPRTPVLVGVGQLSQRVDRGAAALEPVDLMVEALRRAELDAGVAGLLARADSVRVPRLLSWRYGDPGALVAERVGASVRQTVYTVMGGNYVPTLVNLTARDIQAGRADVVLLTGAEAWRTRTAARSAGATLDWTHQDPGTEPTLMLGDDTSLSSPAEIERGVLLPVHVYPMYEVALRAAAGRTPDEQRQHAARLWSRFSEVAATNPHAWIQQAFTPEEIAEPRSDNRMIGYPYTKLMNSNNQVEQSAALIMCSAATAETMGVSRDRWVFPTAGTDAEDHWFLSNRADLHRSPAIRIAGTRAVELAGIGVDDLAHVDLYSCFPSAVEIAADELGLSVERPLTVTGGMSFAGGPWNNYPMHAIATMVARLRDDAGSYGFCSGNGGYTTKHSFGVYATTPPPDGFRFEDLRAEVAATPSRPAADGYAGPVTVEAYTVMHDRDGSPEVGLLALLTPDGGRTWGSSRDTDVMVELEKAECVGRAADLDAEGAVELSGSG